MARSVPEPAVPRQASLARRALAGLAGLLTLTGALALAPETAEAAAGDDITVDEITVMDQAPLPAWLTFAGNATSFVGQSLEGVIADEFGHGPRFDASRFSMSSRYSHQVGNVRAAVLGDVDGATGDARGSAEVVDAVVIADGAVQVLGPQASGYPLRATRALPDDGGVVRGVATLPGPTSGSKDTVAVFTTTGVHLYRISGTTLEPQGTLSSPLGSTGPIPLSGLLDAYQRPAFEHYRHEPALDDNVVAVVGRAVDGTLRGALLRWDRVAQAFTTPEREVEVPGTASPAAIASASIRYDLNTRSLQREVGGQDDYLLAILHRVPGQREAVISRFLTDADSNETTVPLTTNACASDEPSPAAALSVEVLDLRQAGDGDVRDQYAFAAACTAVQRSNPGGPLDQLTVAVAGNYLLKHSSNQSAHLFDFGHVDTGPLAGTTAELRRPAVVVDFPCAASLVWQPTKKVSATESLPWRCDTQLNPNQWLQPSGVAVHVTLQDTAQGLLLANRAWEASTACFDVSGPPCPASNNDVVIAGDRVSRNDRVVGATASFSERTPIVLPLKQEPWKMRVRFASRKGVPIESEEQTAPIPVALLIAPPTVAGANQEVANPEFARSRGSGETSTTTSSHEVGFSLGVDIESPGGMWELEIDAKVGAAFSEEHSTTKTVSVSDFYVGRPDEHTIVYKSALSRRLMGQVIESTTGISAGMPDVPLDIPTGVVTTARTLSSFAAHFPATYAALRPGLEPALPTTIGNPGTYITTDDIDDYCIGTVAGDGVDELLSTPDIQKPDPFKGNPDEHDGPDVLLGQRRHVNAGPGGSVITGNSFSIEEEESAGRFTEMSLGLDVSATLHGIHVGASYEYAWGRGHTSTVAEGVSFTSGVGSIPNPLLENEQYEWSSFLCRRDIGGTLGRLPVWVLNYTVDNYAGSGGLEPLGDVALDAPVHSTVVSSTPGFEWSQDEGTIRSYSLELEAVGANDRREVHNLAASDDSTVAKERSDVAVGWADLHQTNPLLPNQLYRWRVTAIDFFGNETVSPFEFFVTEGPPRDAQLTTSDPGPEAGDPITVTMTHTPAPGPLTYAFNFGDGTTATQSSPSVEHTYAAPGVYVINGTVTSPLGTASASATVSVGPKATDDTYDAVEDTTLEVARNQGVLRNDVGAETAVLLVPPTNGEVDLALDGSFTYEPDENHCGDDAFVYGARGGASSRQATVRIDVACVNDAPTGRDSGTTINEDSSFVVEAPGLLTVVEDVDGDPLTVSLVDDVENGTLDLSSDGAFTYTPDPDWCGLDVFRFEASDGELSTGPLQVRIRVACLNDAPVANPDDPLTAVEDGSAKVQPLLNDTDADGDELRVVLATPAQHGAVDLVTEGPGDPPIGLRYLPEPDFCGSDSFGYRASDGQAESNEVIIEVTVTCVNDAPVAEPDTVQIVEDSLGAVFNPLANDHDVDSTELTIRPVRGPEHGELTATKVSPVWTYRPDPDFCGTDSIDYELTDGELTATGTVTIDVTCVNDAPVGVPDEVQVDEDGVVAVRPLDNDVDVDEGDILVVVLTGQPGHGTLFQEHPLAREVEYRPNPDYCGPDSFTYQADDGPLRSADTTVSIDVVCINDAPVLVPDPPVVIDEDGTITVDPTGNDTDVEGDELVPVIVDEPEHGTVEVDEDGTITYTPDGDFCGTDSFSYEVSDGTTTAGPVEVPVSIACVNDAPVAVDDPGDGDLYRIDQGAGPLVVGGAGVLGNDHDVDGDPLAASVASGPGHGTVVVNPDGTFTYTPDPSFHGVDSFTYHVSDGRGGTDTGEVRIRVRGRTTVVAAPVVLRLIGLRIYLTTFESKLVDAGGNPVPGRTVDFELAGQRRCSAVTDSNGVARCTGQLVGSILALLTGGYTASFDGDEAYIGSAGRGKLIVI